MYSFACFSSCNNYRYLLGRIWEPKKPLYLFVCLNPSTADALKNDPTVRRCINFAKSWGGGSMLIGNLYAYRSTDPTQLQRIVEPVGLFNDEVLRTVCCVADKVCLWLGSDKPVDRTNRKG